MRSTGYSITQRSKYRQARRSRPASIFSTASRKPAPSWCSSMTSRACSRSRRTAFSMKRTPMPEQHEPLPQPLLASLSAFLAENIGVHFTSDRHADLERGMRAAARSVGHANVEMYVRQLLCSPLTREQIETLASHLTI